jgi:hypothetical protein
MTALTQALLGSTSPGLPGPVLPGVGKTVSTVTAPVTALVSPVATAASGAVTAAAGAVNTALGATTSATRSSGQPTGGGATAPVTVTLKIPLG